MNPITIRTPSLVKVTYSPYDCIKNGEVMEVVSCKMETYYLRRNDGLELPFYKHEFQVENKIQRMEELCQRLYECKKELGEFYPEMDLTDFEMAIYSLEDDIDEEK